MSSDPDAAGIRYSQSKLNNRQINVLVGLAHDIIANDAGGGRKIVSIAATDAGFKTNGCGEWTPIS